MRPLPRHMQDVDHSSLSETEARDLERDRKRIQRRIEVLWTRTWRYWVYKNLRCWYNSVDVPLWFQQKHELKLANKLRLSWRAAEINADVEAAFIESTQLPVALAPFTESYRPAIPCVAWEAVDYFRKFFLVGFAMSGFVGRGTVYQTFCTSIVSFLVFVLHMKLWPLKTQEDNVLRATCETHVFLVILTASAMRSDLTHDKFGRNFYDLFLLFSGALCVPLPFILVIYSKIRRAHTVLLDAAIEVPPGVPQRQFRKYTVRYPPCTVLNIFKLACCCC
jgi:hypothetical protein